MSAAKGKSEQAPEPQGETASANLVVVVMRASRGAKAGETRAVDPKRAAELVGAGLAKYAF